MNSLDVFLKNHSIKNSDNVKKNSTHTSIGNRDHNIFGGNYNIEGMELDEFYKLYHKHCILSNKKNYTLVEKQLSGGKMAIDLDFRQLSKTRQFDDTLLESIKDFFINEIHNMGKFKDGDVINYIEFCKNEVNSDTGKGYNKDGIHIIIDINIPDIDQLELRDKLLNEAKKNPIFQKMYDTQLKKTDENDEHTWEAILDEGIIKKTCKWQVYGSSKPLHEKYFVTSSYQFIYDSEDGGYFGVDNLVIDIKNKNLNDFKMISMNIPSKNTLVYNEEYNKELKYNNENKKYNNDVKKSNSKKITIKYNKHTEKILNDDEFCPMGKFILEIINFGLIDENSSGQQHTRWAGIAYCLKNIIENHDVSYELFKIFTLRDCRSNRKDNDYHSKFNECVINPNSKKQYGLNYIKNICITNGDIFRQKYEALYIKYFNNCEHTKLLNFNTDTTIAQLFISLYGSRYSCQGQSIYEYKINIWEDVTDDKYIMLKDITQHLPPLYKKELEIYQSKLDKMVKKNDDNRDQWELEMSNVKIITSSIKYLESHRGSSAIIKMIIPYIRLDNSCHIVYEKYPNIFCFNNVTFDLHENCFIDNSTTNYAMLSTGYSWIEPTDDEMKTIENIIDDILPDKDTKTLVLTYFGTGLYGKNLEAFMIMLGNGRNGKSLLTEMLVEVLGNNMCVTASPNCIQGNDLGSGTANPDIATMNNARSVIFREPSLSNLNGSLIKNITGSDKYSARKLYSNSFDVNIKGSFMLECNQLPKIEFNSGSASFQERLIIVDFPNTFVSKNDVDVENHKLLGNSFYKTVEFKNKYRCAFFKLLTKYFKFYYDEGSDIRDFKTERVNNNGTEFLSESNHLKSWFDDNFRRCKKVKFIHDDIRSTYKKEISIIRFKDIHARYTSDGNIDKQQQRINQKSFKSLFKANDYVGALLKDIVTETELKPFRDLISSTDENEKKLLHVYNHVGDDMSNIFPTGKIKDAMLGYVFKNDDDYENIQSDDELLKSWFIDNFRKCRNGEFSLIKFTDIYELYKEENQMISQEDFKVIFKANDYTSHLLKDIVNDIKDVITGHIFKTANDVDAK
jgi:phage/plasmid-associated DNA primase